VKKLYAFYFVHLDDDYSTKAMFICPDSCDRFEIMKALNENSAEVVKWLAYNPDGKVEYRWQ
jgi:hypothetical protein